MTHGTVRTYKVVIEGNEQEELRSIRVAEEFAPHKGDKIKLADFPNDVFIITRTVGSPDSGDYTIVVEYQSDHDLIAGGSVADFPSFYLRSRKGGTDLSQRSKIY